MAESPPGGFQKRESIQDYPIRSASTAWERETKSL
jgi:hypothetical protein